MTKVHSIFIFLLVLSLQGRAQVYEQSFFLKMMPKMPETVIGITDKEKEAFEIRIDSLEKHFESFAGIYKHPMCPLEKSNQDEMFEFNEIWEELYRLQDTHSEYHVKIEEQMAALSQEEFTKQSELSEELRKIRNAAVKSMKDISGEENRIDKEMYNNHAHYSQKRADLLTKSIMHYKSFIENFAPKARRADTILLPSIMQKPPCAALTNAGNLLLLYKGYLSLFVAPYTPKFE